MDTWLFHTGADRSANALHFINERELPFVLAVSPIQRPQERVAIDRVYPDIVGFARSSARTTGTSIKPTSTNASPSSPDPGSRHPGPGPGPTLSCRRAQQQIDCC